MHKCRHMAVTPCRPLAACLPAVRVRHAHCTQSVQLYLPHTHSVTHEPAYDSLHRAEQSTGIGHDVPQEKPHTFAEAGVLHLLRLESLPILIIILVGLLALAHLLPSNYCRGPVLDGSRCPHVCARLTSPKLNQPVGCSCVCVNWLRATPVTLLHGHCHCSVGHCGSQAAVAATLEEET